MATEKRLINAKGKFVLNAGDLTGHIMCFENGYATVFDRFAKVICTFDLLDAPTVDAVEVVHGCWVDKHYKIACSVCKNSVFIGTSDPLIRKQEKKNLKYCPNCGARTDGACDG